MDYKPTYNLRGTTLHFPIFLGVCSGHVTVFFFWLLDIPVVRIIPIKHHSCPWNIIHVHKTSFMSMKHHHCIKPSYHNFPKKHLESSRYRKHTDFTNKYYTQFPCFFLVPQRHTTKLQPSQPGYQITGSGSNFTWESGKIWGELWTNWWPST